MRAARAAAALLVLAQLGFAGIPPAHQPQPSAQHHHHVSAPDAPSCQGYHDEHCVVCRILSGDVVAPPFAGDLALRVPGPTAAPPSPRIAAPEAALRSLLQARAPPVG